MLWKKIPKPRVRFGRNVGGDDEVVDDEQDEGIPMKDGEIVQSPTTNVIELREPLIEGY